MFKFGWRAQRDKAFFPWSDDLYLVPEASSVKACLLLTVCVFPDSSGQHV